MKPFAHNTALLSQQKTFNYTLSRSRIVVENAFGHLKARWRRLTKRNDMDVINIPHVVNACCVVHNICEMFNDSIPESWFNRDGNGSATHSTSETDASVIRDTLV